MMRLRFREVPVITMIASLLGGQWRVGKARGSEPPAGSFLPYMLMPGIAGPRELGGGLMPLP